MAVVRFFGAAGTVTGSQFLVETGSGKILIDAGLFQGAREWREKNRDLPLYDVKSLDAVLVTHAHVDHTGLLPRLYGLGLRCPVYCSAPTRDLMRIILLDSAELQKEEAAFRKKTGRSRHENPEPLYSEKEVRGLLELLRTVNLSESASVAEGISASFSPVGHILGASAISLRTGKETITFSGDLGRYNAPILEDPKSIDFGDLLLIESTYGNREHPPGDPSEILAEEVSGTVRRRGAVLIPSFSIGRVQMLLFYLRELKEAGRIPDIPVIVDSPMASDATSIYRRYPEWYDEESLGILRDGRKPFDLSKLYFTRGVEDSKKLNSIEEPMIIIAGNGMLSGGRVLHHLFHKVSNPRNTVLFVGYQPNGGRGSWLMRGADSIRIMAQEIPVRASIREVPGLSAHADKNELLKWCRESKKRPGKVVVTHGEPESAEAFASSLRSQLGWDVSVASYGGDVST